ncbi:MAG: ABC transporter permease [Candidatus Moraniibacteriota bacterium]|jgi:putative ABC transport system permease protein
MFSNAKLSLFLAIKTILRGDKGSLMLTVLIMLVVFLNLLFVDAVFKGITATMDNGKINYQYGEVIIEPQIGDKYIKNTNDFIDEIQDFYYVSSVTAHLRTGATLKNDKYNDGRDVAQFEAGVIGVNPEVENESIDLKSHIIEGRFLENNDYGKALLGADMAGGYGSSVFPEDLEGVRTGDVITAEYNNDISREYEIVGIYKTKNFDTDSKMIVLQDDLNSVLGTTNESSEIIVRLTDKHLSQEAVADFSKINLGDYEISDYNDKLSMGATINKSFDMIGSILRIIGSLVAGLVIFIIIFVDIVNRRKQIGILKAIGIPEKAVMYSYVIRGMFYTILGVIFGFLLMNFGVIGFFRAHPIDFPMGDMVPVIKREALRMSIMLFIVAGLIGSFIPAVKEVRKKILTLMR